MKARQAAIMMKLAVYARFIKDGVRNTRADVPIYTPGGRGKEEDVRRRRT